eukprot:GHRR01035686.1.p1 GENE.GHRR01035686.1~~GHRR01035686.1.p1  ORF type:complete len:242 (+),score=58.63 GHRR01035686.1:134-859(+)
MGHPVAPSRRRRAWLNCFGCLTTKDMNNLAAQNGEPVTEPAPSGGIAAADVAKKGAASSSGSVAPVVTVAEVSSSSSGILAVYEPKLTNDVYSTDAAASTSYPQTTAGYHTDWKNLGVCMASARDMEACVDGVLEGSIKSAQTLFARYDMNLDMRLNQQDYYDLMLELNLALPYQDYQRFVDSTFCYADCDSDGLLTIDDFIPLYKSIAAVRRGFKRQDHHSNGQIDRYWGGCRCRVLLAC